MDNWSGKGHPRAPQLRVGDSRQLLGAVVAGYVPGWGSTRAGMSCHLLPATEDVCCSIPRSHRGRMRQDLLHSTAVAAEAKPRLRLRTATCAGVCLELSRAWPGWSSREASAAPVLFPVPWSVSYLQQKAGGTWQERASLLERNKCQGCSRERGGWILQFRSYCLAAINRASHSRGEIKVAVQIQIRWFP